LIARAVLFHDLTPLSIVWAVFSAAILAPTPALIYFRPWAFPVNNPLWSLSLEILVNIVYGFVFASLRSSALVLIALLGAIAIVVTSATHGGLEFGFRWDDFWLGSARVVFPFFAGTLIARRLDSSRSLVFWGHLGIPILLVVFFAPFPKSWIFDAVVTLIVFPVVIYLASRLPRGSAADRIFIYFGALSYPLYLLHYPIVTILSNVSKHFELVGAPLSVAALGSIGIAVVAAAVSLRYYDLPARRLLTSRFRTRKLFPAVEPGH
jgi:peptidoglycan/LPS O-acetylase OafA/YrhL